MSRLKVAAAQMIADPGDLVRSVYDHVRLAGLAAEQGAQLVVFPELSLTGYDRRLTRADALTPKDPRLEPLRVIADVRKILVIAGAPVASEGRLHIGALSFIPGGDYRVYLKQFLHQGEEVAFASGNGGEPLRISDQTICVAICADITHPEHARAAARHDARVYAASCLITPAGYQTDAALLQRYAREHRMAVLLSNYGAAVGEWMSAGCSAIWSNTGELLATASSSGEAIVVASV